MSDISYTVLPQQAKPGHTEPGAVIPRVRIEHCSEALGIGTATPRISWQLESAPVGWVQAAYEIEARGAEDQLVFQTGVVQSEQAVLLPWPFAPLSSRAALNVRVRVRDCEGLLSAWSEAVALEVGLLLPGDWEARFVTPAWDEDTSQEQPAPLLRRDFTVGVGVQKARLYVTALGLYEMQINGQVVGDHLLAPGWSSYSHRLRYQTFDVSALIHEGQNALGALLGNGWFRGRLGFEGKRNFYGERLALLAQLEITYSDGRVDVICTDEDWHAARGPILLNSLYDGETYDARLERPGWSSPGYDARDWSSVHLLERDLATLVAAPGPPVRRTEYIAPVELGLSPTGQTIIDFGQNLAGWLRVKVRGEAGQTLIIRHAEVLERGELCTRILRTAQATDRYTLRGDPDGEIWEPRFTFHGFRYAEITGWPGELQAEDICAVVCHSDMERTGWFECSEPLLNRLHENVVWSMRSNFVDLPTDCPQRDERLGWTGDIQVFAPTACFLYDTMGFLTSWLADLAAEQQQAGGVVPYVVPNILSGSTSPAAAWGDACVIVPWVLYQYYGDMNILATQFESMRAWIDQVAERAGETYLCHDGFQFGDWLDPGAPPDEPGAARTDAYLIATAYFARSTELLAQIAEVLGRPEDAARYSELADCIRRAFNAEYVTPAGRVLSDATTAYALVLQFGLLPDPEQRQHAGERLGVLVKESAYRISTGFVGTPLVCDALCSTGNYEAAFRLLMQREFPSWLYPVTRGATTIWERWDSLLPDGSANADTMTSFNHYALGAVADWLHRQVAGLVSVAPGYRRIAIKPGPVGELTQARARHLSPYGLAESSWCLEQGQMTIRAVIPPNTSACVTLPGSQEGPIEVGSGVHTWVYPYRTETLPIKQ